MLRINDYIFVEKKEHYWNLYYNDILLSELGYYKYVNNRHVYSTINGSYDIDNDIPFFKKISNDIEITSFGYYVNLYNYRDVNTLSNICQLISRDYIFVQINGKKSLIKRDKYIVEVGIGESMYSTTSQINNKRIFKIFNDKHELVYETNIYLLDGIILNDTYLLLYSYKNGNRIYFFDDCKTIHLNHYYGNIISPITHNNNVIVWNYYYFNVKTRTIHYLNNKVFKRKNKDYNIKYFLYKTYYLKNNIIYHNNNKNYKVRNNLYKIEQW